jgi:Phosphoesterase family
VLETRIIIPYPLRFQNRALLATILPKKFNTCWRHAIEPGSAACHARCGTIGYMKRRAKFTPRARATRAQVAAGPVASAQVPIDCIVVLMLENRSFDHLFGTWPGTAGLSQGPFSNRVNPATVAGANNPSIAEGQPALFAVAQGHLGGLGTQRLERSARFGDD